MLCCRTEALHELIKLVAASSVVAGRYGTPLHRAVLYGHMETVGALLEDEVYEPNMITHDVTHSKVQVLDTGLVVTCGSFGQTRVMALRYEQLEVLKLLISKGGATLDRDAHFLLAFEHCFVGG